MHSNNEVGTIQPIKEISSLARAKSIFVHTDAAQSIGKVPLSVGDLGVDLLSIAGHKLYAPKGVGVLYARTGVVLEKFMHGAGQEGGRRSGTENILEIVGLGKACEIAKRDLGVKNAHMKSMRDMLFKGLDVLTDIKCNGHPDMRLPNTLSISFKHVSAGDLLSDIVFQVSASAGAACHSGGVKISHVLEAMGVPEDWATGTVRFSTGNMTTAAEIDEAVRTVIDAVNRLRRSS
jgi:cysteine desulfurase